MIKNKPAEQTEFEFEDAETFSGGKSGSYKDIVLSQFKKCCEEASKEMTVGGITRRIINGQVVEIPVPNQQEIFVNSVKVLDIILVGKIATNKELITERIDEFNKRLKELPVEYEEQRQQIEAAYYPPKTKSIDGMTFIAKISEEEATRKFENFQEEVMLLKENFDTRRIDLYNYKLETLSILMDSLRYFEEIKEVI